MSSLTNFALLSYKTNKILCCCGSVQWEIIENIKMGQENQGTTWPSLTCHLFALTTFWNHLWYMTEQTHGNLQEWLLTMCSTWYNFTRKVRRFSILRGDQGGQCNYTKSIKIQENKLSPKNGILQLSANASPPPFENTFVHS